MSEFIFCIKCGTKLPKEANFCFSCGQNLEILKNLLNDSFAQADKKYHSEAKLVESQYLINTANVTAASKKAEESEKNVDDCGLYLERTKLWLLRFFDSAEKRILDELSEVEKKLKVEQSSLERSVTLK